ARLHHIPRALNIALECRYGIAVGDADDRLCRQMNHGVDFVFTEGALDQIAVAYIAAHHIHALEGAAAHQLALWHPIADEADDAGAGLFQAARQPRSDESGSACDQHGAIRPESAAHTGNGTAATRTHRGPPPR